MPHLLVRAPNHSRDFSLGWLAVAWMEYFCVHGDGGVLGEPVVLGDELTGLTVDAYALHEKPSRLGSRLYDSVFYCRPKGADKSGHGARFALFEALGPCRFAGVAEGGEVYRDPYGLGFTYRYEPGEPMGDHLLSPIIRLMATEEGQVGNVYDTVYFNLTEGLLAKALDRKDDAGLTRINLPRATRGQIIPSTASAASKDGGKETFVGYDESHLYVTPELRRMHATTSRNLRKRKFEGTWYFESTTMFADGENSVAENTIKFAEAIRDGKSRAEPTQLIDWRWGECDDVTDPKKLKAAIADAYGDAAAYNDLDSYVQEFYDPRATEADSRRYFLNARGTRSNAYLRREWWDACGTDATIGTDDAIVLGFDGSRKRARGVTDATALVACRVEDGLLEPLRVWQQPDKLPRDSEGRPISWEVPHAEVDAFVRQVMEERNVVGFYADPAKWESYVAAWERDFGSELQIRSSSQHPIEWWMIGGSNRKVADALASFEDAVVEKQLLHTRNETLTAHVMNARRTPSRVGYGIHKEHPESPNKIDACIAAVLAYQARLVALSRGATAVQRVERDVPVRLI